MEIKNFLIKALVVVSVIIILLLVVGVIGISAFISYVIIHPPPLEPIKDSPLNWGMEYEKVAFKSGDVLIKGWFIPGKNNATIIICHGYGKNKADNLEYAKFLNEHGYNILLFDFRAHGESGGNIVSLGYYERNDLLNAMGYLNKRGLDLKRVGIFGTSMGAVAAILGSANSDIKAIVIDSGFASAESLFQYINKRKVGLPEFPFLPLTIFFWELQTGVKISKLRPVDIIDEAPPVLIIHGDEDTYVNPEDARVLYQNAKEPKELWMVHGANHCEAYGLYEEEYKRRVLNFFDTYLK